MKHIDQSKLVSAMRAVPGNARLKFIDIQVMLGVPPEDFRVLDRALQRARKAGAVKWDSKRGWTVVEKKA